MGIIVEEKNENDGDGRVKFIPGKEFTKRLEKKGWELRSLSGSRHISCKEGNPWRISVPFIRTNR